LQRLPISLPDPKENTVSSSSSPDASKFFEFFKIFVERMGHVTQAVDMGLGLGGVRYVGGNDEVTRRRVNVIEKYKKEKQHFDKMINNLETV
jgi:hypothetical protein